MALTGRQLGRHSGLLDTPGDKPCTFIMSVNMLCTSRQARDVTGYAVTVQRHVLVRKGTRRAPAVRHPDVLRGPLHGAGHRNHAWPKPRLATAVSITHDD